EHRGMRLRAASLTAEWVSSSAVARPRSLGTRYAKRGALERPAGAAGEAHGHHSSRRAGASLAQPGRANVRAWAGPLSGGLQPGVGAALRAALWLSPPQGAGILARSRLSAWHSARQALVVYPTHQAGEPPTGGGGSAVWASRGQPGHPRDHGPGPPGEPGKSQGHGLRPLA